MHTHLSLFSYLLFLFPMLALFFFIFFHVKSRCFFLKTLMTWICLLFSRGPDEHFNEHFSYYEIENFFSSLDMKGQILNMKQGLTLHLSDSLNSLHHNLGPSLIWLNSLHHNLGPVTSHLYLKFGIFGHHIYLH